MSKDVLSSYEYLITSVEEVEDALYLIQEIMDRKLELDTNIGKYTAKKNQKDMRTILSMIMHRFESLVPEHKELAKEYISKWLA